MKVVKQNLSDVLYIADTWIQADRRRVAERVKEAICKVIDAAADTEVIVTCDELLGEIRALDLDKLLGEE